MRAHVRPRISQVPRPTSGMRAPRASTTCIVAPATIGETLHYIEQFSGGEQPASLSRLFGGVENRESHLRGLVDHLEKRAGGSARRALALLPIADRLDRYPDPD